MKFDARIPVFALATLLCTVLACQARSIRAVGWTDETQSLYIDLGSGYVPLSFSKTRRSAPLDVGGRAELLFYARIPTPDSTPEPAARVNLAGASQSELLIFIPRGPEQWHVLNRADGAADFPPDTVDVVNLTGDQIGGSIAGQRIVVDPKGEKRIRLGAWDERAFPVQLNNREIGKDYSYPYMRSSQRYRPGLRMILILVNAAAEETIPNWAIVDRIDA